MLFCRISANFIFELIWIDKRYCNLRGKVRSVLSFWVQFYEMSFHLLRMCQVEMLPEFLTKQATLSQQCYFDLELDNWDNDKTRKLISNPANNNWSISHSDEHSLYIFVNGNESSKRLKSMGTDTKLTIIYRHKLITFTSLLIQRKTIIYLYFTTSSSRTSQ